PWSTSCGTAIRPHALSTADALRASFRRGGDVRPLMPGTAMDADSIPLDWIPTLPRRWWSTAIDGLLLVVILLLPIPRELKLLFALLGLFVYDPVCTGEYVTLGQWL